MQGCLSITFLTILLLSSCNLFSSFSGQSTKINAKPDDERPSETGEGLPGYLVDPGSIAIARTDNDITLGGKAGSAKPDSQDTGKIQIVVLQIDRKVLISDQKDQPNPSFSGTVITIIQTQDDGSFSKSFAISTEDPIILRTYGNPSDKTIPVVEQKVGQTKIAFKDPLDNKPFQTFDITLWKNLVQNSITKKALGSQETQTSMANAGEDATKALNNSNDNETKNPPAAPPVPSQAPAVSYPSQTECNLNGYFWDKLKQSCEISISLASVPYCGNEPQKEKLRDYIESCDPKEESKIVLEYESLFEKGYQIDQCYYTDKTKENVAIGLYKPASLTSTAKVASIIIPASEIFNSKECKR
ncbi:MAG: hypothetical protein HQK54_00110 [Oligoflexales bacterium]|nr:hypothetical protein [Oligoflexales bacterium]